MWCHVRESPIISSWNKKNVFLTCINQYLYFIFWNIQPVIKGLWQFGSHLLTYNKNIIGIYNNNEVHHDSLS